MILIRIIHYPKPATFEYPHNHIKGRVMVLLFGMRNRPQGLTIRQIADYCYNGQKYDSLTVAMSRWVRWKYVTYELLPPPGGYGPKVRYYRIAEKGIRFLQHVPRVLYKYFLNCIKGNITRTQKKNRATMAK